MKRTKYGNKKIEFGGVKFDSKLEMYAYQLMKGYNIDFEFQVPIELIPSHRINGKAIRKCSTIVDFVIKDENSIIYLDTKGYATETAKLKYKMLGYKKLQEGADFQIVWLKNKKEVLEFVNKLRTKNE